MKREELETELDQLTGGDLRVEGMAKRAILKWHDDTIKSLGYVSALQSTVSDLIEDNVLKDVRIQTLEAQLRAAGDRSSEESNDE